MKRTLHRKSESETGKVSNPFITAPSALTISQPGDAAEREADAVAERVTSGGWSAGLRNTPFVQPAIQRKCAECEHEEKEEKVMRKESTTAPPATGTFALKGQLDNTQGQGAALSPATRRQMDQAFGVDFGPVRIHTDSRAATLSRQLQAHAFTYGQDIYFNTGKYDDHSPNGRKLLAHELTHVVQQSGSVQRKQIQRETTATVDNVPGACSFDQHRLIEPAVTQATTWLQTTLRRLDAYSGDPSREPSVRAALESHFHSSTPETAGRVRRILGRVYTDMLNRWDLTVECHTTTDASCNAAGAYVSESQLVFCPNFFQSGTEWRAGTLIHEMAHTLPGITHITDRAYPGDRNYAFLTTIEALTNSASYELFALEVGTNTARRSTAPSDAISDCSDPQQRWARQALATLQRWNRNAQTMLNDQRPDMLSQWQDLQTQFLGGISPAHRQRVKQSTDQVYSRMGSSLSFECERSCDADVSGYYRYFLFITSDTIHLCPLLFALAPDDRIVELYKLILIRFGDASEDYAFNLARMGRSLTSRFWSAPASLTGFD